MVLSSKRVSTVNNSATASGFLCIRSDRGDYFDAEFELTKLEISDFIYILVYFMFMIHNIPKVGILTYPASNRLMFQEMMHG